VLHPAFGAAAQDISSASPLDLTQVAAAATTDQKRPSTFHYSLITIDGSISDQFPLGSDQKVMPGNTTNQIVLGGTAALHVLPNVALYFRRVNHDNISGATNGSGFGTWSYDIEGDYGAAWRISRDVQFETFWKYRYRSCCPNAADGTAFSAKSKTPAGPRAERGLMNNINVRFGPKTRVGSSFVFSEEVQWYHHSLDATIYNNPAYIKAGNTLAGQPNGPSSLVLFETHIYYYASVFGQAKLVPYIGYENKPSYFDNATQPSFQNRVRYGTILHISQNLSLDTYVKNDHSYPAAPNVSHNTTLFTDLLIHLKS
jgi:hypothetical protein